MGLSAPKQRAKISADPNNNTWSRSTDRFGHKILTAQGWTPGSYLGAKNANHSQHYTAANASHIRILLKDDNLGLGAKRGREANTETFGLNAFQGLLGRLNGKSDVQLKKEENARRDVQLALYQGQRWGCVKFVSGGFLVGEEIENSAPAPSNLASTIANANKPLVRLTAQPIVGTAKKRKRDEHLEIAAEIKTTERKKAKSDLKRNVAEDGEQVAKRERRKSRKPRQAAESDSGLLLPSVQDGKPGNKRQKLGKARKEAKRLRLATKEGELEPAMEQSTGSTTPADPESSTPLSLDGQSERRRRKLEKQAWKEAKRLKKERRKKQKSPGNSSDDESTELTTSGCVSDSVAAPKPAVNFSGGRHAVRQRYIQQKKMASLDPRALKEIFMIKSPA